MSKIPRALRGSILGDEEFNRSRVFAGLNVNLLAANLGIRF